MTYRVPTTEPSVAVIGAGPSGIAAAKECLQLGLGERLVVYEKSGDIGGNWVYRDQPGHSSVYETTHSISSKYHSEYEDFPFPPGTPDYPHHTHLRRYFDDYALSFGVIPKIQFHTEVVKVSRSQDGAWQICSRRSSGEAAETFDYLRIPAQVDHPIHAKPITDSTASRSAIPEQADHLFHGKPITCVGMGGMGARVALESEV